MKPTFTLALALLLSGVTSVSADSGMFSKSTFKGFEETLKKNKKLAEVYDKFKPDNCPPLRETHLRLSEASGRHMRVTPVGRHPWSPQPATSTEQTNEIELRYIISNGYCGSVHIKTGLHSGSFISGPGYEWKDPVYDPDVVISKDKSYRWNFFEISDNLDASNALILSPNAAFKRYQRLIVSKTIWSNEFERVYLSKEPFTTGRASNTKLHPVYVFERRPGNPDLDVTVSARDGTIMMKYLSDTPPPVSWKAVEELDKQEDDDEDRFDNVDLSD